MDWTIWKNPCFSGFYFLPPFQASPQGINFLPKKIFTPAAWLCQDKTTKFDLLTLLNN